MRPRRTTGEARDGRPVVVHAVATDNFAGVEQYIAYVAAPLVRLGWNVIVVGGDQTAMGRALAGSGVEHHAGGSLIEVAHRLARLGRIDIVHAHMTNAEAAAVLSSVRTHARLVVTRHFAATRGRSAAARALGLIVRRFVRCQISISQFVADAIDQPSVIIPHGVPSADVGPHDERVVLVAQRFEAEKETAFALRVWAASELSNDGWQMHIAGRGVEAGNLQALADELVHDGSVTFLGFVDDLPLRMARAGIFLATALREAFGLSVAEAMACACAVLAVDGGAHRELLGDVDAALLLTPRGDVNRAARQLRQLAENEAMRNAVGNRLRERQRAEFSLEVHAQRLDRLYRDVLDEPKRARQRSA